MKQEELKIACIGAGSSGTAHMLWFAQRVPGSVVAFCDLDRSLFDNIVDGYLGQNIGNLAGDFKQDVSGLTKEFKNLPYYTDPDEMLDKEDINTVLICTYCNVHAEMIEKCVKRNLNILTEKPLATTEKDVDRCWELLRDYPKVSTINLTFKPSPITLAAKHHIQGGTIGDIMSVQFVNNVHYGDVFFRKWMRTSEKSDTLLLQKATHDLDLINSLIGLKPLSIAAFGSRLLYGGDMPNDLTCDDCDKKWTCPMSIYRLKVEAAKPFPPKYLRKCVYAKEIDLDDNHVVIIQYEGGVTVSYSQTFNAPLRGGQRGGYFIGSEGIMNLKYYNEFTETPEGQMIVGNSSIDITRYHQKPGTRIFELYDWAGQPHFDANTYGFEAKLALLEGRPTEVPNPIVDGYISAKMCLAAQKSIVEKRVVDIELDL